MELLLSLLAFVVLLLIKGFFSGTEIAVVSCDKIKMQTLAKGGNRHAELFLQLYRSPEVILTTTLIGTNLCTVAATTLGALLLFELAPHYGDVLALIVFTPLLLIIGEICPKSIFQEKADDLMPILVHPLNFFVVLFRPISIVFSRIAGFIARRVNKADHAIQLLFTREQLQSIVDSSDKAIGMERFDKRRMLNAIRFGEVTVGEAMVPLHKVIAVDKSASYKTLCNSALKNGHECYPVFEGNSSNVTGVVRADIWSMVRGDSPKEEWQQTIYPPFFVSPRQRIAEIMPQLLENGNRLAVVADEYGSAIGIIKIEDVYSQVVGDVGVGFHFPDSHSETVRTVTEVDGEGYEVDGRLSLTELSEVLHKEIRIIGVFTVGGLVTEVLTHIPKVGELVEYEGFLFEVIEASDRVPTKIRIRSVRGEPFVMGR